MSDYRSEFLSLAIERQVLRFGDFTLKSGRRSPYFFNAGLFDSGEALSRLGKYYAQTIVSSGVSFDVLFGPAYKGIPLAAVTAAALWDQHGMDAPYAFNRKEAKQHGEGGNIVGAPLEGRVLVIDDVITAGTAIRESVDLIASAGAEMAGVVIALDRQEKGLGELSAVQEVEAASNIKVHAIATLADLVGYLGDAAGYEDILAALKEYRKAHGIQA